MKSNKPQKPSRVKRHHSEQHLEGPYVRIRDLRPVVAEAAARGECRHVSDREWDLLEAAVESRNVLDVLFYRTRGENQRLVAKALHPLMLVLDGPPPKKGKRAR